MRLRTKPKALETMLKNPNIVLFKPENKKDKWNLYFDNNRPVYVELGTGKGQFILNNAKRNPDINFIGIDSKNEVLYMALKKILIEDVKNIRLLPFNIENINEVFGNNEIDRLFINFPDPWPKARHEKRRLTSKRFLEKYKDFLKDNSQIILKTDNRPFFDYSVEEIETSGFCITDISYDLVKEKDFENIPTEYEEKFMEKGVKINRLKSLYISGK